MDCRWVYIFGRDGIGFEWDLMGGDRRVCNGVDEWDVRLKREVEFESGFENFVEEGGGLKKI